MVDPPRWGIRDAVLGFLAALVLSSTIGAAILAAGGWSTVDDAPMWGLALLQAPLWAGLGGAAVVASRWRGAGRLRDDFGLSVRPLDIPVGLVIGVVAQFATYVFAWPVIRLSGSSFEEYEKPARELADKADASGFWGVVLFVVVVVVMAPFIEELFYRGLVQRSVVRHVGAPAGIAITALIFGLSHFQAMQLLALVAFGILQGWLAHRTGRLGPAIFSHVGFNATTVVLLLWQASHNGS